MYKNLVTLSSLHNQIFSCSVFTFQLVCLIGSHPFQTYTRPEGEPTTKQLRSLDEKTNCCSNKTISLHKRRSLRGYPSIITKNKTVTWQIFHLGKFAQVKCDKMGLEKSNMPINHTISSAIEACLCRSLLPFLFGISSEAMSWVVHSHQPL